MMSNEKNKLEIKDSFCICLSLNLPNGHAQPLKYGSTTSTKLDKSSTQLHTLNPHLHKIAP